MVKSEYIFHLSEGKEIFSPPPGQNKTKQNKKKQREISALEFKHHEKRKLQGTQKWETLGLLLVWKMQKMQIQLARC